MRYLLYIYTSNIYNLFDIGVCGNFRATKILVALGNLVVLKISKFRKLLGDIVAEALILCFLNEIKY